MIAALAVLASGVAWSAPAPFFHEYVLYLPDKAASPTLAQVRDVLAAGGHAVTHHRLASADEVRHWDGHGIVPLAFEARDLPARSLDDARSADTGDDVREQLHLPASQGPRTLAVMIGVPPPRDLPAYVQALRVTMEAARVDHAPVAWDGELGEYVWIQELANRLADAQRPAPRQPATPSRAPAAAPTRRTSSP